MKKWLLLSVILGTAPLGLMAQDDDDMYFVPSKKSASQVTPVRQASRDAYHASPMMGCNRDVNEYNRRNKSYYEVVGSDSTASDIIDFSAERGVYPDSLQDDDFKLTRQMSRWDGYEPETAYLAGYTAGRRDSWSWHSPWYYSSWYYPWYDSWYYDPWYYGYHGWYSGWYDPWYYSYGWYSPYYHYGWGGLYYGGGYAHDRHYWGGGGGSLAHRGSYAGSIDRSGSSHGRFTGYRGSSTTSASGSSSRYSSARNRTVGTHSSYSGGNYGGGSYGYSDSGHFSGSRSSSYSGGSTRSSSSGGSFSGGGGGHSGGGFSGGGGRGGGGSISSGGRR